MGAFQFQERNGSNDNTTDYFSNFRFNWILFTCAVPDSKMGQQEECQRKTECLGKGHIKNTASSYDPAETNRSSGNPDCW